MRTIAKRIICFVDRKRIFIKKLQNSGKTDSSYNDILGLKIESDNGEFFLNLFKSKEQFNLSLPWVSIPINVIEKIWAYKYDTLDGFGVFPNPDEIDFLVDFEYNEVWENTF